jgi:hypothetical protein
VLKAALHEARGTALPDEADAASFGITSS